MQDRPRRAAFDALTRPICFAPLLLALSAALSYAYADRTMPVPDEGALLVAAAKILRGGVFYRDIDAYAFPGVSYLLAGAMSVFGEHVSVARAIAGAFFCTTVLAVYACAIALFDRNRAALCGLSLLSLKFIAFPIFTMFFYADASVAMAIVALALFLRHRFDGPSWRLFWVGVFVGLSIVTKQSTGIYVGAVFALVISFPAFAHGPTGRKQRLLEASTYGAGLMLIVGSMSMYFAAHGVFGDMIRGGLLRPFTGYLPTSGVSFGPPLSWWNFGDLRLDALVYFPQAYLELALHGTRPGQLLREIYLGFGELFVRLLYSGVAIAYAACAWLWLRAFRATAMDEEEEEKGAHESALARARFFSAAGVTLGIVISAFPRADFIHVITIYPAVTLIVFAICRPSRLGRGSMNDIGSSAEWPRRRLWVETLLIAILLTTSTFLAIRYDATLSHRLSMDRADLWVRPRDAWLGPLVDYVQRNIPKGEPFFVYGHEAHWYFLTDRYMSHPFSQLYPGMTGDERATELADLVRETRPRVIAQGLLRWPGVPPIPRRTRELRRTIRELYVLAPEAVVDPPRREILRVWRLSQ